MTTVTFPTIGIFPDSTSVNPQQHLVIGGCDVAGLAAQYGTPLYVFDGATLRNRARGFVQEFGSRYPRVTALYASKAFINKSLVQIFAEEGMGFDVVSAGELAVVRAAGVPLDRVYFHGNNKGPDELRLALEWGIGRIVVDNFHELDNLESLGAARGRAQDILLRITPGVDPHTHAYISTGATDSKFGFPLATGAAEEAVQRAQALPHVNLIGLHMHLGSQLFETDPYSMAIDGLVEFAASMVRNHGLDLQEFSPGGGFAVQYIEGNAAPGVDVYAQIITDAMRRACASHGLALPRLVIEPGRSSVARAGVAVYTVGAIKDIPGVRKYVSVDGGMADNIRPALYEAKYEAVVANRLDAPLEETVTIAGKYCESGDILITDLHAPRLAPGDLLALPASGAYCLAMSSNYNASPRPAVVLVNQGQSRVIRRRETYDDLMQWDT